jgi:hypothetical protein
VLRLCTQAVEQSCFSCQSNCSMSQAEPVHCSDAVLPITALTGCQSCYSVAANDCQSCKSAQQMLASALDQCCGFGLGRSVSLPHVLFLGDCRCMPLHVSQRARPNVARL